MIHGDRCGKIGGKLRLSGRDKVSIPTVFIASPGVIREAEKGTVASKLRSRGVVISHYLLMLLLPVLQKTSQA